MTLREQDFNWRNLWADLLKGAGRGLLAYDGSRLAQAALAGLEVFDDAQERRRRHEKEEASGVAYQDTLLKLLSTMSPHELAAFLRLQPGEQNAWAKESAEGPNDDAPRAGYAYPSTGIAQPPAAPKPLPRRIRPMYSNPIDGWRLQSFLPFGSDGAMKSPTYRR